MKFEIKFRFSWKASIEIEGDSLKDALEKNKTGANLSGANLSGANLSGANLKEADLSWADLSGANLSGANLKEADLSWANFSGANLSGANLSGADLSGANLSVANLDYSCWSLSCKSLRVKIDKRLFCQLLYHTIRAGQSVNDPEIKKICGMKTVQNLANQFHRVDECGKIETKKEQK